MTDTKFQIDAQGNLVLPDFSELKKKLAENLKSGIFSALPDEFFDHQVQVAFEALTKPRANMPAKGDRRCDACRASTYGHPKGRPECPHNLVERPSEVQEMIQTEMRERLKEKIEALSKKWSERGITDEFILDRLSRMVEATGKAFVTHAAELALKGALSNLAARVTGVEVDIQSLNNVCRQCGMTNVPRGSSCSSCGTYNG
jgi:hypothetical protein